LPQKSTLKTPPTKITTAITTTLAKDAKRKIAKNAILPNLRNFVKTTRNTKISTKKTCKKELCPTQPNNSKK
jgi:hypothetical protein